MYVFFSPILTIMSLSSDNRKVRMHWK